MSGVLFASDLDNTLIYSYRHRNPEDLCVEHNKDREQGFISPVACALLREAVQSGRFVPITTRSVEQYMRIRWPEGCTPAYAVTTNGAILLEHNEIQPDWLADSQNKVRIYQEEMHSLLSALTAQNRFVRCRMVDQMYLFVYCAPEMKMNEIAGEFEGRTGLSVIPSGRKLYFLPPSVNKGTALEKIKARMNADWVLCAGDSRIDLPMLALSDLAMVPGSDLAGALRAQSTLICDAQVPFAEFVLREALKYLPR